MAFQYVQEKPVSGCVEISLIALEEMNAGEIAQRRGLLSMHIKIK
jgi:hypothetical protein